MKALVTGHAGFVGRHMVERLELAGWDVTGIDFRLGPFRNGASYVGDVREFFRDDDVAGYDLVVHCAAVVGGRATIEGQPLSVAVDLSIDAELFQWALRTRPGRIVYYSSSAVYPVHLQEGDPRYPTLDEAQVDIRHSPVLGRPDLSYGWAKLSGEMLANWAQAEGLQVHVLRPFSGYGEDQDLAYPFPSFIERAKQRRDPFVIWGDGTQTRDFIHIDDVIGATLAVVEAGVTVPVNLCTGQATSFNELARLVCAEAQHLPKFEHQLSRPVGVRHRVGNPTRMLRYYTPKVDLEEGIARAFV